MDANKAEALNKSWEDSLANLRKAMSGSGNMDKMMDYSDKDVSKAGYMDDDDSDDKDMMKGKKKKKDDTMKAENDSQLMSDEMTSQPFHVAPDGGTGGGGGSTDHGSEGMRDPGKSMMKKSFTERLKEMESGKVVDVEPFLKSFAEAFEDVSVESTAYLKDELAKLGKSVGEMQQLVKAQSEFVVANAELTKSVQHKVDNLEQTPVDSGSVRTIQDKQVQERFQKSDNPQPLQKAVVYKKAQELLKSGDIDLMMATKIEGRMNKNMPLPKEVAHLFETA